MESRARSLGHSRLGVGVHDGANLDAPSSLDGMPAASSLRDEPPAASVRR